nr:hypothetical protein [uncultured Mediterranean phage uvMED]|tara:strand:+ start:75 stop:272 length:198 start_codon:yes stop_codon:yes gene_type:complete
MYQPISDFFDLRPAREARFDVSRSLQFVKADSLQSNISLITEDNQTKLPFVKTNGSTSNIKLRIA